MDIRKFDNSLGIPREVMPQIPTELIETFVYSLPVFSRKEMRHVRDIKPTQDCFMMEKVLQKQQKFEAGLPDLRVKTLILSSDMYLLDGHHNWAGLLRMNPEYLVSVIIVPIPMTELLIRATLCEYSTTQSYEESYEKLRTEGISV